jgi:hypothetical protein
MATMMVKLYDALRDANVSEEKARAAAKAVADYDTRFAELKLEMAVMRGDIATLKWMGATTIAIATAIALRVSVS